MRPRPGQRALLQPRQFVFRSRDLRLSPHAALRFEKLLWTCLENVPCRAILIGTGLPIPPQPETGPGPAFPTELNRRNPPNPDPLLHTNESSGRRQPSLLPRPLKTLCSRDKESTLRKGERAIQSLLVPSIHRQSSPVSRHGSARPRGPGTAPGRASAQQLLLCYARRRPGPPPGRWDRPKGGIPGHGFPGTQGAPFRAPPPSCVRQSSGHWVPGEGTQAAAPLVGGRQRQCCHGHQCGQGSQWAQRRCSPGQRRARTPL